MKRTRPGVLVVSMLLLPMYLRGETRLAVRHDHGLRSCRGELVFSESHVEYATTNKKDARLWKYEEIQQIGLMGRKRISLVTYEDQQWLLAKDKRFHFKLLEGEVPESLLHFLQTKTPRPVVSAILPRQLSTKIELPAKHQHALGSCQGTLKIGEEFVAYETSHQQDARIWQYRDLASIGSTGPFQLRVSVMERTGSEIGGEKNFIFDLKRRLTPEAYDFLWWKVNGASISTR